MTIKQIENKIIKLLIRELNIKCDDFDFTYINETNFSISLCDENYPSRDEKEMWKIINYIEDSKIGVYQSCEVVNDEDGYIGCFAYFNTINN